MTWPPAAEGPPGMLTEDGGGELVDWGVRDLARGSYRASEAPVRDFM